MTFFVRLLAVKRKFRWHLSVVLITLLSSAVLSSPAAAYALDKDMSKYRFEVPAELEPAVNFWVDVFGKYGRSQSIIHDRRYPGMIFTVLDFDRLIPGWQDNKALGKRRRQLIKNEIKRLAAVFNYLHMLENPNAVVDDDDILYVEKEEINPDTGEKIIVLVPEGGNVSDEEKNRILKMYEGINDPNRFANAEKFLRSQRGIKEKMRKAIVASGAWLPYLETIFEDAGLPVALTRIPMFESGFDANAKSHASAVGMWQFIRTSATKYMRVNRIVDDRRDPLFSTFAAVGHLTDDYKKLERWPLAVNAYNHGRGGMSRAVKTTGSRDITHIINNYRGRSYGFASQNYYPEFLAALIVESNAEVFFGKLKRDEPILFNEVLTRHYISWNTLREMSGASVAEFKQLNPAFKPDVIRGRLLVPPGYRIRVPLGNDALFYAAYEELDDTKVFAGQKQYFAQHTIRRGDTLSKVARKYGTSVAQLKRANNIRNVNNLRVGQRLKVPSGREVSQPDFSSTTLTLATVHKPAPATPVPMDLLPRQLNIAMVGDTSGAKYVVERGDTLGIIAERYGVSTKTLMRANGLSNANLLSVGQALVIPPAGTKPSQVQSVMQTEAGN